jgi:hypothetical protein
MSNVTVPISERVAAADDAQRKYFPEAFRENALRSGDPAQISKALGEPQVTSSGNEATGVVLAAHQLMSGS